MRIVIVVGYYPEHTGYLEVVIARTLSSLGHDVTILTSTRFNPAFTDEMLRAYGYTRDMPAGLVQADGYRIFRLIPKYEWRHMVYCPDVKETLSRLKPDLLICFAVGQLMPFQATRWKRPTQTKMVTIYGDNAANYSTLPKPLRFIKRIIFYLTKGIWYILANNRSDALLCNTPDTIKILRPLRSGRTPQLLPLGFDKEEFFPDADLRCLTRKQLALDDRYVLIVSVGKIVPEKRLEQLVKTISDLHPDQPNLRLLLIGASETNYCRGLYEWILSTPQLKKTVQILPFLDHKELNAYLNAADIGVWPRQPAVTIQEAMGTGIYIVLPRTDQVSHLLRKGSGQYFEPTKDDAMRQAIVAAVGLVEGERWSVREARAEKNNWLEKQQITQLLLSFAETSPER